MVLIKLKKCRKRGKSCHNCQQKGKILAIKKYNKTNTQLKNMGRFVAINLCTA